MAEKWVVTAGPAGPSEVDPRLVGIIEGDSIEDVRLAVELLRETDPTVQINAGDQVYMELMRYAS